MPAARIKLWSERFGASGGFAAEGVKKLLGTPKLSLLQTVLRETVQNTWDARNGKQPIRYLIRLRRLKPAQITFLKNSVFNNLPPSTGEHPISRFLNSENPIVMEIADWGARGLGGPTRADVATGDGKVANFANFVRNIGMAHTGRSGGGTYGYGKSSVYLASQCSTVIIDTLAETTGNPERRLIAAHLGEAFEVKDRKYTGRHWWGVPTSDDALVEPLLASDAGNYAKELGLPDRSAKETGTTIVILGALLGDKPAQILGEIQETILWHFWPKMLDDNGPLNRINFELEVEGQKGNFPSPAQFPPLDLFVEAYRGLKSGTDCKVVQSLKPQKILGNAPRL